MAMVDFSCCMPSTIRLHRYSARRRPASVKDASPPTSSGDGLVEADVRAKPADSIIARTPARRLFQGYAWERSAASTAAVAAGISNKQACAKEN